MEKLNARMGLGCQHFDFTIGRKSTYVGLEPDCTTYQNEDDEYEGKEITTDFSTMSSAEIPEDESYKDLVVDLLLEVWSGGNHNNIVSNLYLARREMTISERLPHLVIQERIKLESLLYGEEILAW